MNVISTDLTARFDRRAICRLCFDDDRDHSENELANAPILNAALMDALGEFKACLKVRGLYSDEQLERLTPESLSLAKRLVCELAMAYLYARRNGETDNVRQLRASVNEYLDRISKGERLFSIIDDKRKEQAGRASMTTPNAFELMQENLVTSRAAPYFGRVDKRLPRRY